MAPVIQEVVKFSLEGPNGKTLKYVLKNDQNEEVTGTVDLDIYIMNDDGRFSWGGKAFSHSAKDVSVDPATGVLSASLRLKNQTYSKKETTVINLAERFHNLNGHLIYLEDDEYVSTGSPRELELEGDIDGRTFAVASDSPNNICRVAYKTVLNNKISFAEVKYDGARKSWSLPQEIDLHDKEATPGQNIAFAIDPRDPAKRHLFFCEETGDGDIRYQTFNPTAKSWGKPKKVGTFRAHRFSKFAACFYRQDDLKLLLLYYVNESKSLQECIGVPDGEDYKWVSKPVGDDNENMPPNTFLAVSQRGKETALIYRAPVTKDITLIKTGERNTKGFAKWGEPQLLVTVKNSDVLRHSPLALAHRHHGQVLSFFYVKRNGRDKFIYTQDYVQNRPPFSPRLVGKLESESILGAASFEHNPVHDARLFSVSNLDGDDILIERYQKFIGTQRVWVIAGGIIDTDVDDLSNQTPGPRSTAVA